MKVFKSSTWRSTCCNAFQIQGYTARKSSLRPVTKWMREKNSSIQVGSKICDTCRKRLAKVSSTPNRDEDAETVGSSSPTPSDSVSDHEIEYEHSEAIGVVNQCLVDLGETQRLRESYNQRSTKKKS